MRVIESGASWDVLVRALVSAIGDVVPPGITVEPLLEPGIMIRRGASSESSHWFCEDAPSVEALLQGALDRIAEACSEETTELYYCAVTTVASRVVGLFGTERSFVAFVVRPL